MALEKITWNLEGSKQSSLQLMGLALIKDESTILNVPRISDVFDFLAIYESIGGVYSFVGNDLEMDSRNVSSRRLEFNKSIFDKFRSSVFFMLLILNRCDEMTIPYPGGCKIGLRPIDIHLDVLKQIGINVYCGEEITLKRTKIILRDVIIKGNSMSASVFALAIKYLFRVRITNIALEPEIDDARNLLSEKAVITMSDINAMATYFSLSSILRKNIILTNFRYSNFYKDECLQYLIKQLNLQTYLSNNILEISSAHSCIEEEIELTTGRYPLLCTDMHPIIVPALMANSYRKIKVSDQVFSDRFQYLKEICRFNNYRYMQISTGSYCIYKVSDFIRRSNIVLEGKDIRETVSFLLVAVLYKNLRFTINGIAHIKRAYEKFDQLICSCSNNIKLQ